MSAEVLVAPNSPSQTGAMPFWVMKPQWLVQTV